MVGSDDSAFQQRPKRFDRVCMRDAAHVFASRMTDKLMLAVIDGDCVVRAVFVRDDERCVSLSYLANEARQSVRVSAFNHLADHVTLAGDCADDRHLAGRNTTGALFAILEMAVLVKSANVGF